MQNTIQALLDKKKITPAKFAKIIGVQRSAVSHILSGRNNPSLDFILKIIKQFPDLNIEWLITGKGNMNKTEPVDIMTVSEKKQNDLPEKNVVNYSEKRLFTDESNITESVVEKTVEKKEETNKKKEVILNELEEINTYASLPTPRSAVERVIIFNKSGSFKEYYPE